jgi:hypothetical protein
MSKDHIPNFSFKKYAILCEKITWVALGFKNKSYFFNRTEKVSNFNIFDEKISKITLKKFNKFIFI